MRHGEPVQVYNLKEAKWACASALKWTAEHPHVDEFQSIWGQTSISHEMLLMSHAHVDEFLWPNEPKQVHAYVELARAHVGEI